MLRITIRTEFNDFKVPRLNRERDRHTKRRDVMNARTYRVTYTDGEVRACRLFPTREMARKFARTRVKRAYPYITEITTDHGFIVNERRVW